MHARRTRRADRSYEANGTTAVVAPHVACVHRRIIHAYRELGVGEGITRTSRDVRMRHNNACGLRGWV
jgi:hypothetical protein